DTFPILKHIPRWLPGAGFKRQAEEWRTLVLAFLEVPFAETKRQMVRDFWLSVFANEDDQVPFNEQHVKQVAGTMFFDGADTSAAGLAYFVQAMLANPEAQRKAQSEIDDLTKGKYLPTFEDEDSLPYVSALVKEVLRWRAIFPLGEPRLLQTEDEYEGYRIPAGSPVIGNTWCVSSVLL
ncbi:cytochrome P450, partial [Roridomyces roridus]